MAKHIRPPVLSVDSRHNIIKIDLWHLIDGKYYNIIQEYDGDGNVERIYTNGKHENT